MIAQNLSWAALGQKRINVEVSGNMGCVNFVPLYLASRRVHWHIGIGQAPQVTDLIKV